MEANYETLQVTRAPEFNRAEIDIQIATARAYPRSIEGFRTKAMSMATTDRDVAASCFYKLRRNSGEGGASSIEGPSVRLAEIVASAWGNLRFGARIVSEDKDFVIAQGVAHDLESNVCTTVEVRRRITNRKGDRFSADMIAVTCNAACAIALRNAIFKAVPFTYVKAIFEQAKKTAVGDSRTLLERRRQMVEAFQKMGVTTEQILAHVERPSLEDVGLKEIEDLIGTYNAIRDGETTIDEQFPPSATKEPQRKSQQVAPTEASAAPQAAPAAAAEPARASEQLPTQAPAESAPQPAAAPVQPASRPELLKRYNDAVKAAKGVLGPDIADAILAEANPMRLTPSAMPLDMLSQLVETLLAEVRKVEQEGEG